MIHAGPTTSFLTVTRVLLLCLTALLLALVYELQASHGRALQRTQDNAETLALALDEKVQGVLRRIESDLVQISNDLPAQAMRPETAPRYRPQVESLLQSHTHRFPELLAFFVWDSEGRSLYGTRGNFAAQRRAISGRQAFELLRDDPRVGKAYTDSIRSAFDGSRTLALYLPVRDREGRFLGVVSGSINLDHLARTFAAMNLKSGSAVFIRRVDDHHLVIRHPVGAESDYNRPVLNGIQERIDRGETSGRDRFRAVTDGQNRIYGFRRLQEYPFYIVVGLDERSYLEGWRSNAIGILASVAVLSVLLGLMLGRLRHQERLRAQIQRELEQSHRFFAESVDNISVGFTVFDADDRLVICNDAYRDMYGEHRDIVRVGAGFSEMLRQKAKLGLYVAAIGREDEWVAERLRVHQRADGKPVEYLLSSGHWVLVIEHRTPSGYIISNRLDITDRKRLEAELREQATTDALTGLANRRQLMARLQEEHQRVQRKTTRSACVLMLDLDHFKRINDTYGHAGGDQLLRHVAALLQQEARNTDTPARVGGEEFSVILPGTDLQTAKAVAERICKRVEEESLQIDGKTVRATVSIGVACIQPEDSTGDAALLRADEALYRAKESGRNQVQLAD